MATQEEATHASLRAALANNNPYMYGSGFQGNAMLGGPTMWSQWLQNNPTLANTFMRSAFEQDFGPSSTYVNNTGLRRSMGLGAQAQTPNVKMQQTQAQMLAEQLKQAQRAAQAPAKGAGIMNPSMQMSSSQSYTPQLSTQLAGPGVPGYQGGAPMNPNRAKRYANEDRKYVYDQRNREAGDYELQQELARRLQAMQEMALQEQIRSNKVQEEGDYVTRQQQQEKINWAKEILKGWF